jgi:hypothetical protein
MLVLYAILLVVGSLLFGPPDHWLWWALFPVFWAQDAYDSKVQRRREEAHARMISALEKLNEHIHREEVGSIAHTDK